MSTPTATPFSPSPSTSPKGVDRLARVAGKPLPKVDEKRSSRAFKSFLGKTGLIDPLRAAGACRLPRIPTNRWNARQKTTCIPPVTRSKLARFQGINLGIIWGSFGDQLKLISMSHVTIPWFAWVVIGDEQEE